MDVFDVISPFLLIWLLLARSATSARPVYDDHYLDRNCGKNVTIPCPEAQNCRAGTLHMRAYALLHVDVCKVHVMLEKDCGLFHDAYAIYFNIRQFVLPDTDSLYLYDYRNGEPIIIRKIRRNYGGGGSDPRSAAQALTHPSSQPTVLFEHYRGSQVASMNTETLIDYIVVEQQSETSNRYCNALNGYIHNDYICDKEGAVDRVNCPDQYNTFTDPEELNPALGRQYCRSYDYIEPTELSKDVIVGIVLGVVFGVFFVASTVAYVCMRRRRPQKGMQKPGFGMIPSGNANPTISAGSYYPPQPSASVAPLPYPNSVEQNSKASMPSAPRY